MKERLKINYALINSLAAAFFIIDIVVIYTSSVRLWDIVFVIIIWLSAYVLGMNFLRSLESLVVFVKVKFLQYTISLFFLLPIMVSLMLWAERRYYNEYYLTYNNMEDVCAVIVMVVLVLLFVLEVSLFILQSKKSYRKGLLNLYENKTPTNQLNTTESTATNDQVLIETEDLLGKDDGVSDKVIKSLLFRASTAIKTSKFSLVMMVILVLVGGGASIGTIALDQFTKIRELEKHRLTLLKITDQLAPEQLQSSYSDSVNDYYKAIDTSSYVGVDPYFSYYQMDSLKLAEIKKIVINTYGSRDTYKDLLTSLNNQSNFSVTEIIMRVTIAALTLFLVQVFFHIYRYNQQQSTSLYTKAEVIELYKDVGADKSALRETLASKLEENPKFGKSPSTPIEQIISIADKGKNAGR